MLIGASDAESLLNLTARVWRNTIFEEWDSETNPYTRKNEYWERYFNNSLKYLFADSKTKKTVDSIVSSQDSVANIMKELQNPPKEYRKAYETISQLYNAYQGATIWQ